MSEALPVDLTVGIRAEISLADPDTCKFAVSRMVHPGGPFFFDNKERAAGSPLVERLFALTGVQSVLIAESVVTVGKEPGTLVVGIESRHRRGHSDATAHRGTSDPGDASERKQPGRGPTKRSARSFKNSSTGRSTVPSPATVARSRSWTFATGSSSSR